MNATQPSRRSRTGQSRSSSPDRPRARRPAHSVEALEARLLLSGLPTQKASTLLPLPVDVASQIPQGPQLPQSTVGLPDGPLNLRDDSYVLAPVDGHPGVQIDLIWPEGPDPSEGQLVISDASGVALYVLSLDGVDAIEGRFPIPSVQGVSSVLDVNLQITSALANPASNGSYRLAISWVQPPTTQNSSAPGAQVSSGSGTVSPPSVISIGFAAGGTSSGPWSGQVADGLPPRPPGTISVSKDLPTPLLPPSANPLPVDSSPYSVTGGGGNAAFAPIVSLPPRSVAVPADPSPSTGSTSTTPVAPQGSYQVYLPLASSESGIGSPALSGSGNRPAVVGPLPLGGSGPDGGIFAYPYGQTKAQHDPFRPTFTITPTPGPADGLDDLDRLAEVPGHPRSAQVPFEVPGFEPFSFARPFDLDMAGTPLATGAAFLPPIGHLAGGRLDRADDRNQPSRWPIAHARTRLRGLPGVVLLGSAGLVFGLVAPDCLRILASWQDDRRWKRQYRLTDPERHITPGRDV